ncbi:MAG: hypothetical protein K0R41_764 [Geminicoccaceae bacterium]|jgi:hypothetical protein|nr:hypothetical protein [Geminicoccaceae bacterium]
MALTVAERQHRYRQRLAERKLAVHKLPGLPASHRDRLARLVAVERTQLRATIAKLRRKRGESALAELRAERALRWWGALAAAQGLEATVGEGAEEGKTRSPRGSHAG